MGGKEAKKERHDFVGRNHETVLTPEQFEHFDESMRLMNESPPSDQIDMRKAVQSVKKDLGRLLT